MSESKHDESFKVVDRRLFTPEGEFRKDVAEQQDRERETAPAAVLRHGRQGRAGGDREQCRKASRRRARFRLQSRPQMRRSDLLCLKI